MSRYKDPLNLDFKLRELREKCNMTQAQAAAHYGIEERTLRRWENQEFNVKLIDFVGLVTGVYNKKVEINIYD